MKIQQNGITMKNEISSMGKSNHLIPRMRSELNPQNEYFVNRLSHTTNGMATMIPARRANFHFLQKFTLPSNDNAKGPAKEKSMMSRQVRVFKVKGILKITDHFLNKIRIKVGCLSFFSPKKPVVPGDYFGEKGRSFF